MKDRSNHRFKQLREIPNMINIKTNNKYTCLFTSKSKSLKVARKGRVKMNFYTY